MNQPSVWITPQCISGTQISVFFRTNRLSPHTKCICQELFLLRYLFHWTNSYPAGIPFCAVSTYPIFSSTSFPYRLWLSH